MKHPLIALDQFANTMINIEGDGFGYPDETISARAFRLFLQDVIDHKLYTFIDSLFFFEYDHCYKSWRSEAEGWQNHPSYKEESC